MYRFADEDEDSNKKIHEGLIPILEEYMNYKSEELRDEIDKDKLSL